MTVTGDASVDEEGQEERRVEEGPDVETEEGSMRRPFFFSSSTHFKRGGPARSDGLISVDWLLDWSELMPSVMCGEGCKGSTASFVPADVLARVESSVDVDERNVCW